MAENNQKAEEALREEKEMKIIGPEPWARINVAPSRNQFCLTPCVGIVFTHLYFRVRVAFMFLNFRFSVGFLRRPGWGD